jgi:hypothetical protein
MIRQEQFMFSLFVDGRCADATIKYSSAESDSAVERYIEEQSDRVEQDSQVTGSEVEWKVQVKCGPTVVNSAVER